MSTNGWTRGPRAAAVCIAAAIFVPSLAAPSLAADVHVAAMSGWPAPGAEAGTRYARFRSACLNEHGQIAFQAGLLGSPQWGDNDSGVFSSGPSGPADPITLRLRQHDAVSGAPGAFIDSIRSVNINRDGALSLQGALRDPAGQLSYAYLAWSPSGLSLSARDGDLAPGTSGAAYRVLSPRAPALNDAGRVLFVARAEGDGGSTSALWAGPPANPMLVAREGHPVPGLPGSTFGPILIEGADHAANGRLVFMAQVNSGDGPVPAILSGFAGDLHQVAYVGMPAPRLEPGVTFQAISPGSARIATSAQVAFGARLTGPGVTPANSSSIWSTPGGVLNLAVRAGTPAPGLGDLRLGDLTLHAFNDHGDMTFFTSLRDAAGDLVANSGAMYLRHGGAMTLLAKGGAQAPGLDAGVTFDSRFLASQINNAGQAVFLASLRSAAPGVVQAIFGYDPASGVFPVAVEGHPLLLAPGDERVVQTLSSFERVSTGGSLARVLDDEGTLVFTARFADGTEAVLTATIPAPASGLALLGLALTRRRR